MFHQLKDQINYDERQMMERGRAFKYGYLTILGFLLLLFAIDSLSDSLSISTYTMFSIPFWVSVAVLHAHTARHGAFDGLTNGNATPLLAAMMFGAGVYIVAFDIYKLVSGRESFIQNGLVTDLTGSVVAGVCMVVIGITHWLCRRANRKAADE